MAIVIYTLNDGTKRGFHIILVCIGLINLVTAVPLSTFSFVGQIFIDDNEMESTISKTIFISLLLSQLHINPSLAYDRYLAVTEPMQYRQWCGSEPIAREALFLYASL